MIAEVIAGRLKVVGEFLNVKHDMAAGDAWGYSLQLWRQGNEIFGLFSTYVGPEGDPPTGLLEDVKFNPRTRQLSFKARLSTGPIYGRGYEGAPSRDIFQFKGALGRKTVVGVLTISNGLFPNDRPKLKRITLRRSPLSSQDMIAPQTYAEWKTWADEILKHLGPKW